MDSLAREASPQAAQPSVTLLVADELLKFARIQPHAVAFVTSIDFDVVKRKLIERALALRALNCRCLTFCFGSLGANLLDQLLFLAPEVFFFERLFPFIPNL